MSISADIESVKETAEGYELELTGRMYRQSNGYVDPGLPGQPFLTILDPTWKPEVGMSIWGGSDIVIIESSPKRAYNRVGYTYLRERC